MTTLISYYYSDIIACKDVSRAGLLYLLTQMVSHCITIAAALHETDDAMADGKTGGPWHIVVGINGSHLSYNPQDP